MLYLLSYKSPHHHLIDIQYTIPNVSNDEIYVQLPAWRPGRYELANFAQNIKAFQPKDSSGKKLRFEKVTKDRWKIYSKGAKTVHIDYVYYANVLNAGSMFLDETLLLVNGVNCLLYVPERIHEACELRLQIPKNYQVATALNKTGACRFSASDYHELADCPLIASPLLQKSHYTVHRTIFTVWFHGDIQPDWKKLLTDFKKLTETLFKMFGSFPFMEYHFLFLAMPVRFHHGVEHGGSTVIAVGPSYALMNGAAYEDFLGVSSHELFHAWNVKAIRPVEMMPYDYSRENYSRLGYVAEGVTTYYGDLLLLRSGIFSEEQYLTAFDCLLERHFANFGSQNLSVADSSFDTWLDGYKEGVPGRKSSIYTEGALCAFMLDIIIRRLTRNRHSLDDVMRTLYEEYGKKQKGYSEEDYKLTAEKIAGVSLTLFFEKFIWNASPYIQELSSSLDYIGYELMPQNNRPFFERSLGFKIQMTGEKTLVASVFPNSPADKGGLALQDEIIAINGMRVEGNLSEWCTYFSGSRKIVFTVASGKRMKEIQLAPDRNNYFPTYKVIRHKEITEQQKINYQLWAAG